MRARHGQVGQNRQGKPAIPMRRMLRDGHPCQGWPRRGEEDAPVRALADRQVHGIGGRIFGRRDPAHRHPVVRAVLVESAAAVLPRTFADAGRRRGVRREDGVGGAAGGRPRDVEPRRLGFRGQGTLLGLEGVFPEPQEGRGANPCCVVGDGQKGLLKAVREVFPRAKVQRCVVHVHRQAMAWLTRNPKTDAGRELRQLVSALLLNPHAAAAGRLAPVAARVGTGVRRLPEGAHVRRARLVAHAPEAAGRQVAAQERRAGPVPLRRRPLGSQDVESRGGRTQQPDQGAAALASWDIKTPASGAGVVVPPFQAEKTNTKCHLAPIKPENTVLVKPMYGPVTFTQDTFLAKKNADLRPALLRKSVYRPATIRVHAFSRNGGGFRRVTDGCSPTAPAPSTSQRRSYSAGPMTNRPVSNSAFSPTGTAAGAPQGT